MNRGGRDYDGGGSRYGGNKRSHDDEGHYGGGGDDRGGYKRSRYDGGGYNRPQNGGGRDERRYGGGGGSSYDRRRDAGPPAESDHARAWRLTKKGIVEVGENTSAPGTYDAVHGHELRDQLTDVASKIKNELDGDQNQVKVDVIATLIVRCAGRLAHKTALYAVLVGLVNETTRAFGRAVVDQVLKVLPLDLDFFTSTETGSGDEDELRTSNDCNAVAQRVRLLVRFLGELVSTRVVKGEDLLGVLDTLQGVCTPDDFTNESDDRSMTLRKRENAAAFKDYCVAVVLDVLVHCGQALAVGNEDIYDSLLSRCKEYISNREEESNPRNIGDISVQAVNWLERRLRLDLLWEPESEAELLAACKKCDPLTLLWEALNLTRSEPVPVTGGDVNPHLRWKVPGVLYPQELFERHFVAVEPHALNASVSVDFSSLDHAKIPRYEAVFRIFGEDSGAIGAPLTNLHLASYLTVRGHLSDAIEAFHPKPAIAAKHLLGLARSYNVRFADAEVSNLKTEYVLLECLLVKALNETQVARLGYLCSVLTHLVKVDARLISPAFAIVVELLFREVPVMNASASDAFVKLFSHFLSNFEYKWAWARWSDVLEASEDDTQRLFVSSVIERCVRLSYLQHMESALPAEFHSLLPPAPKPRVIYQAEDESTMASAAKDFFHAVATKLKSHPPANAFYTWLEEELNNGSGIDRPLAVDIVFTAILEAGAATFTHSRLMLEKYGVLGDLFSGSEAELQLVKTVGFVWVNSPQHIGLILNMMLRQRIVQASTIAKWIFTTDAVQQYSWPYVWGILDDTLTFMVSEIAHAKRGLRSPTAGGDADMNGGDESLTRLEEDLHELLKGVFVGFNRVIAEYKTNCDADGISYRDNWFMSALAQLKAVGAKYRVQVEEIAENVLVDVFSGGHTDTDTKKAFEFVQDSYRSN